MDMSEELMNILSTHNGCDRHPSPGWDPGTLSRRWFSFGYRGLVQHVCGFKSMEQLNNWFSPRCQELLLQEGFVLRCIRVPTRAMICGEFQVVVHKRYVQSL